MLKQVTYFIILINVSYFLFGYHVSFATIIREKLKKKIIKIMLFVLSRLFNLKKKSFIIMASLVTS